MTQKYILTGGPGTGKSTLIREWNNTGFYVLGEAAEYIIHRESARGGNKLPWKDFEAFQEQVMITQRTWEAEIPKHQEIAFLDRSLVDGVAYCRLKGCKLPNGIEESIRTANYAGVFIIEPLPRYENTDVRRETPENAIRIHEAIRQTYKDFGFKPLSIPVMSVQDRFWDIWARTKFFQEERRAA